MMTDAALDERLHRDGEVWRAGLLPPPSLTRALREIDEPTRSSRRWRRPRRAPRRLAGWAVAVVLVAAAALTITARSRAAHTTNTGAGGTAQITQYQGLPTSAGPLASAGTGHRQGVVAAAAWTEDGKLALVTYGCPGVYVLRTLLVPGTQVIRVEILRPVNCTGDLVARTVVVPPPAGVDTRRPLDIDSSNGTHVTLPPR
jgi:hypothetical protein